MNFTKKNVFAIGAAVMMTASLATFASAATNAPVSILYDTGIASVQAVDVDLSTIDFSQMLEGTPVVDGPIVSEAGEASYEIVDVDLSAMDFGQMLEGTAVPAGIVDPSTVPGGFTTQAKPAK